MGASEIDRRSRERDDKENEGDDEVSFRFSGSPERGHKRKSGMVASVTAEEEEKQLRSL